MREIKFRAWDNLKNIMIKEVWEIGLGIIEDCESWLIGDDQHVKNFILMQYIGLQDKTGRDIYEGDIIQWINYTTNDGIKNITVIEYDDKDASFYIGNWYDRHFPDTSKEALIIGNIYENPALLDWCIQI